MVTKNNSSFTISPHDKAWLEEVYQIYIHHLKDRRLRISFVAKKMNLSERQFYRRFKEISPLTPNQSLQELRLLKGKDLLENGHKMSVKEVTFAVGYHDARYFSDIFEKRFGIKPSLLTSTV